MRSCSVQSIGWYSSCMSHRLVLGRCLCTIIARTRLGGYHMLKRSLIGLVLVLSCGGDSAGPGPQPPAAPVNPRTSASPTEIAILWDDAQDETLYRVEFRQEATASWVLLQEVPANTTTIKHVGIARNVQYHYRVAACNSAGCSGWAETSGKWIPAAVPPTLLTLETGTIGGHAASFIATARAGGMPVTFVFAITKAGEAAPFYTTEVVNVEPDFNTDIEGIATGFVNVNGLQPATDYVVNVTAANYFGYGPGIESKPFRTRTLSAPTFTNPINTTSGFGLPAFAVTIHPNGFDTSYRFEIVRAVDSFATPLSTSSGFAPALNTNWYTYNTGVPNVAEPGVLYKWRVVAQNAVGTSV